MVEKHENLKNQMIPEYHKYASISSQIKRMMDKNRPRFTFMNSTIFLFCSYFFLLILPSVVLALLR